MQSSFRLLFRQRSRATPIRGAIGTRAVSGGARRTPVALAGLIVALAWPGLQGVAGTQGPLTAETKTKKTTDSTAPAKSAQDPKPKRPAIESGVRRWHARGATRIALPDGYALPRPRRKEFQTKGYRLLLYAQNFAQGRAVYVEILPPASAGNTGVPKNFQAALVYGKKTVPLSRHRFGYRGFVGIAPYASVGKHVFAVTAGAAPGGVHSGRHQVQVAKTNFPVYRSAMNLGKFSDTSKPLTAAQLKQIKAGRVKKNRAFNLRTDNRIDNRLSHPRDLHKITSPFWARRVVSRYKIKNGKRVNLKAKTSTHGGLDLRAVTGAPIYALANARVAVAEAMYYEGKFTMLDHGQGVMSIYMHQSALGVQAGQTISAGQEIGKAGATGAVTGAHLHIAVYIRRVPVEPLSFLALPVRD